MIANLQVQSCKVLANSILANMGVVDSDRELIEALVAHSGLSASEIAKKAKLTPSTLTRPLNHPVNYKLSRPTLAKLREAFPSFPGFRTTADLPAIAPDRDYLAVEVLPSFAGMGGGGTGEGDVEHALIPRRLVVDELRAKPDDLLLIEARGQSMEPDFHHGDQILVDKRDCNPVQPGAFALWDGDGYVVKLVERVPRQLGRYRIFSANDRYSAYEVEAEDVRIMGRPVWFGRRL
jgi:hypothetical protein